jgi:hypothetical protein
MPISKVSDGQHADAGVAWQLKMPEAERKAAGIPGANLFPQWP